MKWGEYQGLFKWAGVTVAGNQVVNEEKTQCGQMSTQP